MDAFGSGKQKRALKKRRSNKMSLSSVTQAVGSAVNSDALAECLTTPGNRWSGNYLPSLHPPLVKFSVLFLLLLRCL